MAGLRPGKDGKLPMHEPPEKKMAEPKMGGDGGEKTHTITEHADGHLTSHMHGGEPMEHPDHLHMLAHVGHHISGGDKHHVVHHDGAMMHSHGMNEAGEHDGTHDHQNLDELKQSMDQFLGEEGQEGQPEYGGEQQAGLSGFQG
jgi:hypothetical protein